MFKATFTYQLAPPTGLRRANMRGVEPPSNSEQPFLREQGTIRRIRVSPKHTIAATQIFDTYWRFAVLRQDLFMKRVMGTPANSPADPILSEYRFTNVYRAADRVSQYLIRHVLYEGEQTPREIVFRCLLFKFFNRVETWEFLSQEFGPLSSTNFRPDESSRLLDKLVESRETVYSGAYIMPCPQFNHTRKHWNHLRLLRFMLDDGVSERIQQADSLEQIYLVLRSYPSIGSFLAFQLAIDLNYSSILEFSEMDFVVAGPGARDGISKCFADTDGLSHADVIRAVTDMCDGEFERLNLHFRDLWGRRLHLIDIQNLFCEVDKYARVAHPLSAGRSKRKRIKQKYSPSPKPLPQWYPPKWKLAVPESLSCPSDLAEPMPLTRASPNARFQQLSLRVESADPSTPRTP